MTDENSHASRVAEQLAMADGGGQEESTHLPDWDVYQKLQSIEGRQEMAVEWAQAYQEAALDDLHDIPEDVEMYDDYRTQEQHDLATAAIEEGSIPDLSKSTGALHWYRLKAHAQVWAGCEGLSEEELREKLQSLQEARENKRKPSYRDGSYNQFLAWNSSCQAAVRWLLGDHEELEEVLE
jgi:hypothetical protein